MLKNWNFFWKQIELTAEEFNAYIDSGIPVIAQQKIARFIREFDKLKQLAVKMDEIIQNPIEPIEVKLPFEEEEFIVVWKYWKAYRLESFGRAYKSREEQKVLDYLDEISEGRPDVAIKFLNFAMAGSYQKFFKVTENSYTNPPKDNSYESEYDR